MNPEQLANNDNAVNAFQMYSENVLDTSVLTQDGFMDALAYFLNMEKRQIPKEQMDNLKEYRKSASQDTTCPECCGEPMEYMMITSHPNYHNGYYWKCLECDLILPPNTKKERTKVIKADWMKKSEIFMTNGKDGVIAKNVGKNTTEDDWVADCPICNSRITRHDVTLRLSDNQIAIRKIEEYCKWYGQEDLDGERWEIIQSILDWLQQEEK